jgi:hypothetical protein
LKGLLHYIRFALMLFDAAWIDMWRAASAYPKHRLDMTWADFWKMSDPEQWRPYLFLRHKLRLEILPKMVHYRTWGEQPYLILGWRPYFILYLHPSAWPQFSFWKPLHRKRVQFSFGVFHAQFTVAVPLSEEWLSRKGLLSPCEACGWVHTDWALITRFISVAREEMRESVLATISEQVVQDLKEQLDADFTRAATQHLPAQTEGVRPEPRPECVPGT